MLLRAKNEVPRLRGRLLVVVYSGYGTVDKTKRPRVSGDDHTIPAAASHELVLEP